MSQLARETGLSREGL